MPFQAKNKVLIAIPSALTAGFLSGCIGMVGANGPTPIVSTASSSASTGSDSADPVIAAAGDIACDPSKETVNKADDAGATCQMAATANLLTGNLVAVLPLGDTQYESGELANFQKSYAPTWGKVKAITRPVVGNHEYRTPEAAGYFNYFGTRAGDPKTGYYSYDIGNWHLIALNANCSEVGGCEAGSRQEKLLKADLAAHPAKCTLAYWHQPRFSSAIHGNDPAYDAFWRALYAAGAEIVLNGHDHDYERFGPQTPAAKADSKNGIRQFVVGTGGKNLYPFVKAQPNSQVRNDKTYGVLKLTLHAQSYDWQFVPTKGGTFTDSGSSPCH